MALCAQVEEPATPLPMEGGLAEPADHTWVWRLDAAELALRQGFSPLAARLYEELLATDSIPGEVAERIRLERATALISLADGEGAAEQLSGMPARPAVMLRQALAEYLRGAPDEAARLLASYPPEELSAADLPWHFMAEGLLAHVEGDSAEASRFFAGAAERAANGAQRAQFRLMRLRAELLEGAASEDMVSQLRATARGMVGQTLGFEANRMLALVLHRLGRVEEAVSVTENLLQQPGVLDSPRREELLLILGLMLGDESGRGRVALRQLLTLPASVPRQRTALALLSTAPLQGSYREEFRGFLGQLLSAPAGHPLFGELLLTRAALAAQAGHYDASEMDAQRFIEELPGSELLPEALRLLAYVNWSRTPPRYRTAASHLNRLRSIVEPGPPRARIFARIGDCYFLNEDYANAAEAYTSALREGERAGDGNLLFQRVLSEIRAGRLDAAAAALDEPAALGNARRWEAEYNLLDALREADRSHDAFVRVRQLLDRSSIDALPVPLQARMRWMEARLALDAERAAEVPQMSDELLEWLETGDGSTLDESERNPVRSHVLLLKGEALLRLGLRAEGVAVLRTLRGDYPDSGPEMLSYLLESRIAAADNSVVDAQVSLIGLADRFPQSRYAPIALWEAALLAEQRGLDSAYREAMGILDRLYRGYPNHPISYYARIKQGDLSRRLNDFGTALAIYEGVLADYPDHPERFRAELSRGDCLLARGSASNESLVAASVIYERIFEDQRTPVDAAVEAGYKWITALRQRELPAEAREASFVMKARFFNAPGHVALLGARGRYWLSRALVDLAGSLEGEAGVESLERAGRVYLEILESGLPGRAIAESRLARLRPGLAEARSQ